MVGVLQGLKQQDESWDRLQHWESQDKYLSKGKTTACIEKGYLLDRKGILLVERGYFSIGKERGTTISCQTEVLEYLAFLRS